MIANLAARNDDWLRTMTWDIWTPKYAKLVSTVDELLVHLDVAGQSSDAQRAVLRHFMDLPAAEPMPKELRSEIEQFLGGSDLAISIAKALVAKFNPAHDEAGRFTSGDGTIRQTEGLFQNGKAGEYSKWITVWKEPYIKRIVTEYFPDKTVEQFKTEAQANVDRIMKDANVFVRVREPILDKILDDGRMKTQFESKQSSGGYNPSLRRDFEEKVLGVSRTAKGDDRPIYGYVSNDPNGRMLEEVQHPRGIEGVDNYALAQYGEVVVALKSTARDRSTFTYSDSIDDSGWSGERTTKGPLVYRGGSAGFYGQAVDPKPWDDGPIHEDYYPRTAPSKITKPSIYSFPDIESGDRIQSYKNIDEVSGRYSEAQIFGGVHLKDIDRVLFSNEPQPDTAMKLKKTGIPYQVVKP